MLRPLRRSVESACYAAATQLTDEFGRNPKRSGVVNINDVLNDHLELDLVCIDWILLNA